MDWIQEKQRVKGSLSITECKELALWASRFAGSLALEVGHYQGLSTCALLSALPADSVLWTIDHHLGDPWAAPSDVTSFESNVAHALLHRGPTAKLEVLYDDFRTALPRLPDGIGFVFYDADHRLEAVEDFWRIIQPKLAPSCLLLYDDADWDGMKYLGESAKAAGFRCARMTSLARLHGDKHNQNTYTIEVMARP